MGKLTPQGYVADQLKDIFNAFVSGLQGIYGDDILIDSDDPDGQLAGILAQMRADVEGVILAIYQANDPDNATGVWLEQKVAYAYLQRRLASYSYLLDVLLIGAPNTPIRAGVIIRDSTGEQWVTDTAINLDGQGRAVIDFRSQDVGQYSVPSNTELTIVTITNGWDSATTQTASQLGEEEETDPELLSRFYRSRSKPSINAIDSTVGDILALPGVIDVIPLENTSDTIDVNDVNPHTVNYIVDGGDNNQIAQAIYNNWPGTGMQGAITIPIKRKYTDKTTDISFDRPTPIDMAANITIGRRKNFTFIDTAQITKNVVAMKFRTGESVYQDDIVDIVKQTEGAYVKSILYGRKGAALADVSVIAMGSVEKARFLDGDVTVTITDD